MLEPVVGAGQFLGVAGHPVRLAQLGRGGDRGRELGEGLEQVGLARVRQERGVVAVALRDAALGGVAEHAVGARVRVLHVVDRVLVAVLGPQVDVEVDRRVGRVAGERVAGGVDADGLDDVLQGHHGPHALGHPHRSALLQEVDHLADEDLQGARLVAEGPADRLHPAHVAVVVGPEHEHELAEAALALVQIVGAVGGEVGPRAVGLLEHPVLVVAELGGAQPGRALGLEDVAELGQPFQGGVELALVVELLLVEVHVEVRAEVGEGGLDLVEHQLHPGDAEHLPGVLGLERVGMPVQDLGGDLVDVGAAVAVLGDRLALGAGQQRVREAVDLGSGVVEVVLGGHLRAGGAHDSGEGVAHGRPAGAARVDRPGRVRRDELEVDVRALHRLVVAVGGAGDHDLPGDAAGGGGVERDVEEAGAGDVGLRDAVELGQSGGDLLGQRSRIRAGLLGHLEGDRGGVVPVLGVSGSLHGRFGGQRGGVEAEVGERGARGGQHFLCERLWSHQAILDAGLRRPRAINPVVARLRGAVRRGR